MITVALAAAALTLGVPVTVHCASDAQTNEAVTRYQMPSTPQGWSFLGERVIYLRRWVCNRLSHPRSRLHAIAVGVFAHELGHVATHSYSEAVAERWRRRNEGRIRVLLDTTSTKGRHDA